MRKIRAIGIAALPTGLRRKLRRRWHVHRAKTGRLHSDEPEFHRLKDWLAPGDVAIDVGANIGSFTLRMSELVGPHGQVFAFEPIPETFATLARNIEVRGATNVTLINAACGQTTGFVSMDVPKDGAGGENLYMARISDDASDFRVLCLNVDSLHLPGRIRLVKVDAEGFDAEVIHGMRELLAKSRPRIVVESRTPALETMLASLGYRLTVEPGSPNAVFEPAGSPAVSP